MATEQASRSWLENRLPACAAWRAVFSDYRSPREQPYLATLPALILGTAVLLALTGLVLGIYYVAQGGDAYNSIQYIRRGVNFGWLLQSLHASGATMILAAAYLMLFRGILTGEYRGAYDLAWFFKLNLFILLLLAGWFGYVLTDGAVSAWSLQDTALAGLRLAGLGGLIAGWVFGGPAGAGTLGRMAVFHGVFGLLILLAALAVIGANRLAAAAPGHRTVAFHPYYTAQHFVAFVVFALIFAVILFFLPHLGENLLNLAPANPLVVPTALTPPWYLLPFSALSGVLPGGYGGIIAVVAALAVLYALPWLDRTPAGRPPRALHKFFVWVLAADVIALALTATPGAGSALLSGLFVAWYFVHFLIITPLTTGGV